MDERTYQQGLIDQAHASRLKGKAGGGIETLTFFRRELNGFGLSLLAEQRPDLKGLYLMETAIVDDGFEAINQFRQLEELNLQDTKLTDEALLKMDPTLPLRTLSLNLRQVTPRGLTQVVQMTSLRDLDAGHVVYWVEVQDRRWPGPPEDESLLALAPMTWLESLNFCGRIITGPGLDAVRGMSKLSVLHIGHTQAPAVALASLAINQELRSLYLSSTQLDDDALEALSSLPDLVDLSISSTPITDKSIDTILRFPHLQSLSIENVQLSRKAAQRVFELPSLEYLEIAIEGTEGEYWNQFIQNRPGFHLEA